MRTRDFLILAAALLASPAHAQPDKGWHQPDSSKRWALARVTSRWDAGCSGSTRSAWDNMVDHWYDEISNGSSAPSGHGSEEWNRDGFYANGDIRDQQFCDATERVWGQDNGDDNADEPDAMFIGGHGNHFSASTRWYVKMRVDGACGTNCNCSASQGDMAFGDYDAEFVHLSSCHSMCRKNWFDDPATGTNEAEWQEAFAGVHQVNGFHGLMYISPTYYGRYTDFADDGFYIAIADSWIDNQYSSGTWTAGEHCPVSFAMGDAAQSAASRLGTEEYDWVYDEPGTYTTWSATYIGGCDPDEESALP